MGGRKGQLYVTSLEKKQRTIKKKNFLGYFSDFNFELTHFRRHHHLFELCKVWDILMLTEFSFLKSTIYIYIFSRSIKVFYINIKNENLRYI